MDDEKCERPSPLHKVASESGYDCKGKAEHSLLTSRFRGSKSITTKTAIEYPAHEKNDPKCPTILQEAHNRGRYFGSGLAWQMSLLHRALGRPTRRRTWSVAFVLGQILLRARARDRGLNPDRTSIPQGVDRAMEPVFRQESLGWWVTSANGRTRRMMLIIHYPLQGKRSMGRRRRWGLCLEGGIERRR